MTTDIRSNGSRWAGEEPDTIESLLKTLAQEPLDRKFEAFGNFVTFEAELLDGSRMTGMTSFFGNFYTVSHVFNIDTDDEAIIKPLTKAIKANQLRPDYLAQPVPKAIV